jgi:uncharacterized membrane protein (UPF0127 family)
MASNKLIKNRLKISFWLAAILIFIFSCLLLLAGWNKEKNASNPLVNIAIKNQIIKAEVVSSPVKEYLGLSNRESLCKNCGMLFVFSDAGEKNFVMRNMNFSLDIIFINKNKIINIAANLPPEGSNPKNIYQSIAPADKVLEINGGDSRKYNIKAGDSITIKNNN